MKNNEIRKETAASSNASSAANTPNGSPQKKLYVPGLIRVMRLLFKFFPRLLPFSIICTVFSAIVATVPAILTQKVIESIEHWFQIPNGWESASKEIIPMIVFLIVLYFISLCASIAYNQINVNITHGFMNRLRCLMFGDMQYLPIKYFDSHKHGDIMSHYTNDTDTLHQLVSQTLPAFISASTIVICVIILMLYYSLWLTLIVLIGVFAMLVVSRKIGGGSAKFFVQQQKTLGKTEGFVQEMMSGQKVIKVFCHEQRSQEDFDALNEELFQVSYKANSYANSLGPIIMNIGNVLYVICAMVGGLLTLSGFHNVSFSGLPFSVAIVIPFLGMCRQFTGNINQLSQQINSIVMAIAGAGRIFSLMDEKPEADKGYVTLANAEEDGNGNLVETDRHTGKWVWKHPHTDGSEITYTPLRGDVRLENVDFAYEEGKPVLHDITVYAEPGQKVAFVGATGAGKTTITNLINRFYDIADGKIRYDGININKIKKSDLRRSLGIVLQDTNLFSGTVMENIRYGNLDATDEECIAAAKLAGADDFITRLPQGYESMLSNNGSNLSQGQRQLLAIARAAVADPPVMILDEATSSIDTRTEAIVQRGMDKLMEGRTVFVIAHRLSTVMNSDVIMVLDHGRIIERGSHEKLISDRGVYYQLYTGAFELE